MNATKLVSKQYLQMAFFSILVAQEYLYSTLLSFLRHTYSAIRKKGHIPSLSIINITSKIYKVYLKNYTETIILVSKEYSQIAFIFSNPFRATMFRLLSFLRHTCSALRKKKPTPSLSIINIP